MPRLESSSERMDPDSIRALIAAVNEYVCGLIGDPDRWSDLKARCISLLVETRKEAEFFEFSERSVISNLYWGIEGIESGMRAEEEDRLRESERMLQVPALLEELGTTSGIPNGFLVCVSYLYLAVVKRLQGDDWQVAMHLLQALLVGPGLFRGVLAPDLCEFLFPSGAQGSVSAWESAEDMDAEEEAIRNLARKYRDQLMYYRVMLSRESLPAQDGYVFRDLPENNSGCFRDRVSVSSNDSSCDIENGQLWATNSEVGQVRLVEPSLASGSYLLHINGAADEEYWREDCEYIHRGSEFLAVEEEEEKASTTTKRRLQDMLEEPQSDSDLDSTCSGFSPLDDVVEECELEEDKETRSSKPCMMITEEHQLAGSDRKELSKEVFPSTLSKARRHRPFDGDYCVPEINRTNITLCKNLGQVGDFSSSISKLRDQKQELQLFDQIAATSRRAAPMKRTKSWSSNKDHLQKDPVKDAQTDLLVIFEKAISKLCFSEGLAKLDEEKSVLEITAVYEMLDNKAGVKYTMLKEVILEQLLSAISTSKEERVVRMSVSILTTIASGNHSVLRDIKRKGLRLCDLASALKRNVHEAATLIYLIKPTPSEIKTLELLPTLVEVVCTQGNHTRLSKPVIEVPLTPPVASLMIIEVLVTAFDCATNTTHLAVISSPRVLHGLLEIARYSGGEESISLATIIVKCMQFDRECRVYVSQCAPVAPFLGLLQGKKKRAKFIALEFFHEILCMPRSAAIGLLQRIRKEGGADIMQSLMLCLDSLESHQRLFAAELLIQLDVLVNSTSRSGYTEAAMRVLLESMSIEVDQLAASILSNLGGTYSWTGEPYTIAWLVKKAGLTSPHQRNMIKDFDWEEQSLQDMEMDSWCSKVVKSVISIGKPVFETLRRGLKSKIKQISRDSLTTIAWLGYEIAKGPHALRYSACEILIGELEQFLHPGVDLEERLLACQCIYNYASGGKGMQKLVHFSEGVRESLRRLSGISWMAEELHKVADYYLPHKSRISCVHTQVLEAGHTYSGPVNALIYYKGLLWSGHSDGSIKVWDIKGQTATLVWDRKEHNKAVTCFVLFEQGETLLSGSSDGTIKVWKMVQRKLECVEVICVNEPIKQLETHGKTILVVPQGYGIKVLDPSRTAREICKSKKVKCVSVIQGKIYAGCKDSSIQETSTNYHEREIKAASKRWMLQRKPISSIFAYKDWVYTAGPGVDGSNIKDWRRKCEAQTRISAERGAFVMAIGVVEDFVYLCSSSTSSVLQIWLRGTQQKVGRISAGSKITSLLTANDVVICGTEAGLIKGWIPL